MGATGRPHKLTEKVQADLESAFRKGQSIESACARARIGTTTYGRWMAWGKQGREPFRGFREAIKKARADGEFDLLDALDTAAKNGSVAALIFKLKAIHGYSDTGPPMPVEEAEVIEAIDPTAPDAAEQLAKQLAEKLPGDVLARAVEISRGEAG